MIVMVDHQFRHAAVNAYILSGNESCLIRAEIQDHIGNIQRIPDSSGRLLQGIRASIYSVRCIDPAR